MLNMLLLLISQLSPEAPVLVKDFRQDWMVQEQQQFVAFGDRDPDAVSTVYFTIVPAQFKNQHLTVQCPEKWQLFVNGNLIFSGIGNALFAMDSIAHEPDQSVLVGVQIGRAHV